MYKVFHPLKYYDIGSLVSNVALALGLSKYHIGLLDSGTGTVLTIPVLKIGVGNRSGVTSHKGNGICTRVVHVYSSVLESSLCCRCPVSFCRSTSNIGRHGQCRRWSTAAPGDERKA